MARPARWRCLRAPIVEYIDRCSRLLQRAASGARSNASIFVHPKSLKDPAVAEAVERAIANLRYGSVAVNHWAWAQLRDGDANLGRVSGPPDRRHSVGARRRAQHLYVRQAAEVGGARPVSGMAQGLLWFIDNKNAAEIGRKMTYFNADPSLMRLPGLIWANLRRLAVLSVR